MRRPPALPVVLLAGAVGVQGLLSARAPGGPALEALLSGGGEAAGRGLATLPMLVLTGLVGRVLLSLLPPGPLGGHGARELPTTWAASHLLGLLVVGTTTALLQPSSRAALLAILLPWALVAAVRSATLPGAMVPRHDERLAAFERPPTALSVALGLVALAPALLLLSRAPGGSPGEHPAPGGLAAAIGRAQELLGAAPVGGLPLSIALGWTALLLLTGRALAQARREPVTRVLFLLAAALCPLPLALRVVLPDAEVVLAAAFVGLAATQGVSWLRRADRRALVLAQLALAGAALAGEPLPALGGGLLLVGTTPAPSRARCARGTVAILALTLVTIATAPGGRFSPLLWGAVSGSVGDGEASPGALLSLAFEPRVTGILFWGVVPGLLLLRRRWSPGGDGPVARPGRELVLSAGLVLVAVLSWLTAGRTTPEHVLVALAPAWIALGLALLPPIAQPAGPETP